MIKNPTTGNYIQYKDLAAVYRTDDSKASKVYPYLNNPINTVAWTNGYRSAGHYPKCSCTDY